MPVAAEPRPTGGGFTFPRLARAPAASFCCRCHSLQHLMQNFRNEGSLRFHPLPFPDRWPYLEAFFPLIVAPGLSCAVGALLVVPCLHATVLLHLEAVVSFARVQGSRSKMTFFQGGRNRKKYKFFGNCNSNHVFICLGCSRRTSAGKTVAEGPALLLRGF